jgi:hypothetical protein
VGKKDTTILSYRLLRKSLKAPRKNVSSNVRCLKTWFRSSSAPASSLPWGPKPWHLSYKKHGLILIRNREQLYAFLLHVSLENRLLYLLLEGKNLNVQRAFQKSRDAKLRTETVL